MTSVLRVRFRVLWERFRRALLVPRTCKRSSQLLSAEQVPPGLGGDEPRRGPPLERGPPGRRRRGGRRGRGERPQPTRFGHHERPETESLCAKTDLPAFTIIGHHKPGFNFSLVTPMVSPRDPSLSPGLLWSQARARRATRSAARGAWTPPGASTRGCPRAARSSSRRTSRHRTHPFRQHFSARALGWRLHLDRRHFSSSQGCVAAPH